MTTIKARHRTLARGADILTVVLSGQAAALNTPLIAALANHRVMILSLSTGSATAATVYLEGTAGGVGLPTLHVGAGGTVHIQKRDGLALFPVGEGIQVDTTGVGTTDTNVTYAYIQNPS